MAQRLFLLLVLVVTLGDPSTAVAVDPDFSRLTIRTPQDADRQRAFLTQLVFGAPTLPAVFPQVDGSRLVYPLPLGFSSTAFLYAPAQPNQNLVIYHHGHFNNAEIAQIEQSVKDHFLPAGYSVLFVNMPLYGSNADSRYPNPQNHNDFYAQTPNAIRYFLEPLVAFTNYLAPRYKRIVMLGLSGGGWSTVMYSALDTRIAKSYPVAGSYPRYITDQVPMSRDVEQYDPAIYDRIDYLDFYAIAGMRHQLQIYNYQDPCCFFGDYGKQYEPAVADVVRPYGGSFGVYVDFQNTTHSISEAAFSLILGDLAVQTPFGGTPWPVPGTIEAENFDNGGEGVAYHDTEPENFKGNVYRTSAVEVGPTTDVGGGYNIGYTRAGEWLEYTVNVARAGTYTLEVRVASEGAGGTFHVEFDGVDKSGPMTVPNTGGWQNWTTLVKTNVALNAGTQVMRLSEGAVGPSGSIGNINWIRLSATALAIPGTIQAEDFDEGGEGVAYHDSDATNNGGAYRSTGVDIQATQDVGGGYDVGWTRAGEWLRYTVNVATAGFYTIEARVASDGVGGTFHVEFDGVDKTGAYAVPNTGGWESWTTLTKTGIFLDAGQHVMRLFEDAVGPSGSIANINWIRFTQEAGSQTPFSGAPAGIPGTIQAEDFDNGGEGVAYHDTEPENFKGNVYRTSGVEVAPTTDIGGGYNVGYTRSGEWLEYTVSVATAGTYTFETRVASDGVGGTFHVELDGVDKTGPISVPNTGGWQSWQTLTKTGVVLPAGVHVLRLAEDAVGPSGSIANINWLRFTAATAAAQTPFGGVAWPIPGLIETENFDNGGEGIAYHDMELENFAGNAYRTSGVEVAPTTDTGGGYNIGYTRTGEWLEYTVNVASAGAYTVEVRVASNGAGGTFHLEFDGADKTGAFTVPDTGGWQNWITLAKTNVMLNAGTQVLRLYEDAVGPSGSIGNINWIRFTQP